MEITQTKDFELIARLNRHVHEVHTKLYPEYFPEYNYEAMREFFEKIVGRPDHLFLLAHEGGESVGYAWIEMRSYPDNPFRKPYRAVFVHNISINEDKRNEGLGTKMMDRIYEISKSHGIGRIELDYWVLNEAAARFYEKQGFNSYREFVYKELP
jgi:ribosomal protein S18 acetylase RimI-like enzyme